MNCLEFRRCLGAGPNSRDAEFVAHRESCAACAAAHARALAFEADLERALDRAVPEGLADRILFAQTTGERRTHGDLRRRRWFTALAVAASLVIVVFGMYRHGQRGLPLADLVVEHVLHHEPHATEARGVLPDADISKAFSAHGIALANVPAGISYVHECPVGPYRTVHMVMPDGDAAVSVVYVADPDRRVRRDSASAGMHAREVPLGDGALVMVAADTRGFERIETVWREVFATPVAASLTPPVATVARRIAAHGDSALPVAP